jgi:hypothetical protein
VNRHAKASSAGPSTRQANGRGAVIRGALALAFALVAFAGIGASAASAAAPTIKAFAAGPVNSDQATINGEVNPLGEPTTYWFEWGTEDCETSSCQSSPHQSAGFDEQQRVVVNASAGQFTLSFEGQTTPDLPFNAPTASVQAALEALSTIGSGNVSVSQSPTHYLVTFTGALANTDVEALSAASGTTPLTLNEGAESGSVTVTNVIQGGRGHFSNGFVNGFINGAKHVSQLLSGLSPETTYHFRVMAESGSTTIKGPDEEFTTAATEPPCTNSGMPGTNFLPDCRAYEMVSPTEKNGADVIPNSYKTFAAEVGDGVSYPTLGAFGDVKGTSVDVQYLSRRDGAPATNGWSTHSINPLGHALKLLEAFHGAGPGYQALTPDLSDGIYDSSGTLEGAPDSPNVAGVTNLYRLRDLEANEPQLDLLTQSAAPVENVAPRQNKYAGASKDLSHVIFESPYDLASGGGYVGGPGNLYEYADGAGLRLVGRIPSGSATECDDQGASPCEEAAEVSPGLPISLIPGGTSYPDGMISDDGSRIIFKTPATESGSSSGNIYMREDGERTYQLNASEKTTPDSPQIAQVWAMSSDGSRVFFTTGAELVNADEDISSDLYMYEVGKPAGQRLTLLSVDHEPADGHYVTSVFGTSEDGHYVYFVSDNQLVAGEPTVYGGTGLYLWHDGQISYIGAFANNNLANENTPAASSQFVSSTKASRVSPDGHSLLFMSTNDGGFAGRGGYPGYDHGAACAASADGCHRELYLYSAETGRLTCVSCNPQSDVATGDARTDENPGVSGSTMSQHLSHALSADGQHVFFSTTESLVSEDTNGVSDAYEYDVASGTVHLISSGTSPQASYFMDASPDGSDVFFVTRERLVGWDIDSNYDLYDARVNGGFPEPVPVPAPCEGESCLPSSKPAPGISPTASAATGPGNPKPTCPKGSKRVKSRGGKSRCVAKKAKKHAKHHKANNNRRAGR